MHAQFWIDSWDEGGYRTSFHRPDVHPYVQQLTPPGSLVGQRVLVPLCGKTNDLTWYREHAEHVTGVELVEQAVLEFFAEQRLAYVRHERPAGTWFEADGLTMVCADYLALEPDDVGRVDVVYDRAALVALPPSMRPAYLETTARLAAPGSTTLLITLEYAPLLDEPPFSIAPDEVERSCAGTYRVEHVTGPDVPDHGLKRHHGLDFVREHGFLLTRLADPAP